MKHLWRCLLKKLLQNANAGTLSTKNMAARVITPAIKRPLLLVTAATLIIGAGLYLNWPAIVTLGLAPLILTFAPCALMCAFGLCAMSGSKNRTEGKQPTQDDEP
jgi:hypothetical protein